MIPVTTPTFVITIKNAGSYLTNTVKLVAELRQQDVLIRKQTDDLVIDTQNNKVSISLSQQQTAKFLYKNGKVEIQLHGLLSDNFTSWKTYVVSVPVDRSLSKEILYNANVGNNG